MSLGPVDVSTLRRSGAAFLAVLAAAIVAVVWYGGRTVGRGIHVDVEFATAGPLKSGAKLRLAGREIGEVRSMYRAHCKDVEGGDCVVAGCFLLSDAARFVRHNSELFIATPSILGEAYVEIGPPRGEPGPAVFDGDRVRGVDPPDLDRLLGRLDANLAVILSLLREQREPFEQLLAAGDSLLTELSGLEPKDGRGALPRIADAVEKSADDLRAILHGLDDAHAVERTHALVRDLGDIAGKVAPELADVEVRIGVAQARLEAMADLVAPARRAQLEHALADLRAAAARGEQIAALGQAMAASVARGDGTVGGFLSDNTLWDDFQFIGRVLKRQPWTLIIKTPKNAKTLVVP